MSIDTLEKRASATNFFLTTVLPLPDGTISAADRIQSGREYSGISTAVVEYPATTIRERIISAIMARLAEIRIINGYNTECGATVLRAKKLVDSSNLPFINVWPQIDEEIVPDYGNTVCTMPIRIECLVQFGAANPSVIVSKILGDVIENITGIDWILPFSTGTTEIEIGDTITGAISGATGYVSNVNLMEGTWDGNDAAGQLSVRRLTGIFQTENLKVGDDIVAYTEWGIYGTSAIENVTNNLAKTIECIEGGTDNHPDDNSIAAGAVAIFNIGYNYKFGDPYNN